MWYCNLCEHDHMYGCPTEARIQASERYAESLYPQEEDNE